MIITLKRTDTVKKYFFGLCYSTVVTTHEEQVYIPDEKESKPVPKPIEKPPKKKKKAKKTNTDNDHLDGMDKQLERLKSNENPVKPIHNLEDN